jgi:hypothetical protein
MRCGAGTAFWRWRNIAYRQQSRSGRTNEGFLLMECLSVPIPVPAIQVTENDGKSADWEAYVAAHPQATFFHQYDWLKLVE